MPASTRDWGIYVVAGVAAIASIASALIAFLASVSAQKRQERSDLAKMVQGSALQAIQDISSISYENYSSNSFRALKNSVMFNLPSSSPNSEEIRAHLQKSDAIYSAEAFETWQIELVKHFSNLLDEYWVE